MKSLAEHLRESTWGLLVARSFAKKIAASKQQTRRLVLELFSTDVEVRKRAADVARRLTEGNAIMLEPYFDELIGVLEALPPSENQTRWHLGLVVARIAHTGEQRARAARLMLTLAEDESNVVRCSAAEGLGTLALREQSLRDETETLIHRYLRTGTPAMKSRARQVEKLLARVRG